MSSEQVPVTLVRADDFGVRWKQDLPALPAVGSGVLDKTGRQWRVRDVWHVALADSVKPGVYLLVEQSADVDAIALATTDSAPAQPPRRLY